KDRISVSKREKTHILRELPRIIAGVKPLTLAREWNKRGIPTVTGVPWRAPTIRYMYLRPRMCGLVTYQGEILRDEEGNEVKGQGRVDPHEGRIRRGGCGMGPLGAHHAVTSRRPRPGLPHNLPTLAVRTVRQVQRTHARGASPQPAHGRTGSQLPLPRQRHRGM